eukprot:Gb_23910 [translate_table: standard]
MPAMKFCKRYREYVQRQQDRLPGVSYVEFKKFKKILKRCAVKCRRQSGTSIASEDESSSDELKNNAEGDGIRKACHNCCPACDRAFFPSLLDEMAAVVCCFNARAKQLLELHLASGFRKYLVWMRSRVAGDHLAMIQEGRNLVNYASINAIAIRKILKKYDKVHYSKKGRAFRTRAQAMQMEILQSPWLNELIAFSINLMNANNSATFVSDFGDCSLTFEGGKPSLSCTLLDSVKLDIDLTCSICLLIPPASYALAIAYMGIQGLEKCSLQPIQEGNETVFDPVSLKCGHIFCYSCACSAASVTIVEGLKTADKNTKCPLCRQVGFLMPVNYERVYEDAVHLVELSILLSKSCKEYWEQRLQRERVERLQQAKEHWESQCRSFMGI